MIIKVELCDDDYNSRVVTMIIKVELCDNDYKSRVM